ncbi:amidohydrolase family protein [Aurantiacibacter hainanensis]|uniref:amidohydrolase family protein n=1 Tax=Aurantiacibacter hainanensis TaxID=3076114 RepID=UPI0030C72D33
MRRLSLATIAAALAAGPAYAQQPVIDMHVHAETVADYPPGMQYCIPLMANEPVLDHSRPYVDQYGEAWFDAACDDPLVAVETDEELLARTIARLEANNAIALLQGPPDRVRQWVAAAPDRFIPSLGFRIGRGDAYEDVEAMRELFANGGFVMLGEVTNQYHGIEPDDARMRPFWALMEELDVPVGYHMGLGLPGVIAFYPDFRVSAGNPLLLEPVLHRHPDLRISIQHMASGFHDELKMMLWSYPQLYVEISGPITWSDDFHVYLRDLVDAGLAGRIMFGTDSLVWPEMLDRSIAIIEEADYLTDQQKHDILFGNAVRFLELDEAAMRARAMGE